jgi:Fur family ferric uptake transcriptional regulator
VGIIRKTKSVNLLLDVFDQSQHALSVVQLVESTKEQMNKTTVYRVLDRLEKEGLVYSFLGTNGLKWYAKCTKCNSDHTCQMHTNFQCNTCGSMECIPIQIDIPEIPNIQINSAQVMLSGTCSKCAE